MSGVANWVVAAILGVSAASVTGQDVVLHLKGDGPVTHLSGKYKCDAAGITLGLPAGVFTVRYVQAGDTSLAIVPVKGKDLVFAAVVSAGGARYVARNLTWWDARVPMLIQDDHSTLEKQATCTEAD